MRVLSRRLRHQVRSTLGQFVGLAVVIAVGIALYIGMHTTLTNMRHSQEVFYEANNFADHYFYVTRAPEAILKQIAAVHGVSRVSGRIQQDVTLLRADGRRATVRLTSYPLPLDQGVNKVELKAGRYFAQYAGGGAFEALVDPAFYAANQPGPDGTLDIIAEGHEYPITIVGAASGPEFAYIMKDATTILNDPQTFGIMMISNPQAQTIFNLPGQVNQVLVQFNPGTDEKAATASIKGILKPYGNLADFGREDQPSHVVVKNEIDQIANIADFIPGLFLGIAAAVQFILIRRMVKAQRPQIGVFKALGYTNTQVMLHYSSYTAIIGVLGALIGILLGSAVARFFLQLYTQYFNLPITTDSINLRVIAFSVALAVGMSLLAGLSAARSIIGINPAASMRTVAPISASHSLLEKWGWLWQRLDSSWKMAWRTIGRNRVRVLVFLLGVASAAALLTISLVMSDSTNYLLQQHFTREISYDYMLRFERPVPESELLDIARVEGVGKIEGFLTVPVKVHFQDRSADDVLQGQGAMNSLKFPLTQDNRPLVIPETGVIISDKTARKLGIQVGDTVTLESALAGSPIYTANMRVTGVNYQMMGAESYASLRQVNRLIHQTGLVSGAALLVEEASRPNFEKQLADVPGIVSLQSRQDEKANIDSMMGTMVGTIGTMVFFSALLGFIIVFNTVLLSFNERRKEMASLLTIGFTRQDISRLMFKETLPQAVLGVLIGLPVGRALTGLYFSTMDYEMWTIPVTAQPASYLGAALGGAVFVFLGQWFATRGIKDLDTVELLKNAD